jgi:hypothetical protein
MEKTEFLEAKPYLAPALRVVPVQCAGSILSNVEPIDGGDDPDLEW